MSACHAGVATEGLPSIRSKLVAKGLSLGVAGPSGSLCDAVGGLEGSETRRSVVVGPFRCLFGVGGFKPRLKRALVGACTPGRRVCPGKGAVSSIFPKSNFLSRVGVGSKVKWSVCTDDGSAAGSDEYGVENCSNSSGCGMGSGGITEVVEPDFDIDLLSPREVAKARMEELTVVPRHDELEQFMMQAKRTP